MIVDPASGLPEEVDLGDVGELVVIGRGGGGTVASVRGHPLVVKRYHRPDEVDEDALRRFVGWRRELRDGDRARLDRSTTWPLATVTEAGRPVGFVMCRVPDRFAAVVRGPSGDRRTVLREAQYLFCRTTQSRRLGLPDVALEDRLAVVYELVDTVAFLHRCRVVVGDLSSRNVVWSAAPPAVVLLDCDSFVLGLVGSPVPPTATVDWDDPSQPGVSAASSDVYKLALFVLRAAACSFQRRDPQLAAGALDPAGTALLAASLSPAVDARPSSAAWARWAAGRRAATTSR